MTPQEEPTTLDFDARVFSLEAVKKAAYRFGARCSVRIEVPQEAVVRVTLESRLGEDALLVARDFRTEVLDQDLREVVAKETEAIRNLILLQAFSKTSLLDGDGESGSVERDPLGIRQPDPR